MASKTVLVVEDNELNMKLVRSLLKIRNYGVLEAVDAETGIQFTRKHQPDLVLMDVQLPGIDGLKATQIIKGDPALKDIPVVALTSYASLRQIRILILEILQYIPVVKILIFLDLAKTISFLDGH
jgi:CheY-like chemotaxis protein